MTVENFANTSHRRLNPLTGEWVLVSPQRMQRPWQGKLEATPASSGLAHDPACYLCASNARSGGKRNPDYPHTFVFDNDFPALLAGAPDLRSDDGLFVAEGESGVCRVICFSPRHDMTLSQMAVEDIVRVVEVWADETAALGAREDISCVQIIENRGEIMGCSNPHPHGQIWATRHLPNELVKEDERQAAYFARTGRVLLMDYLERELALDARLVAANDEFVALVPYWAIWPFETMILPRRRMGDFNEMRRDEYAGLANIISQLTRAYDKLFGVPFPYSMGFHQQPADAAAHPGWQMHAHYYPPLLRSATVKKFMVGFEMLGSPQRDITPEAAAARLREAAA